MSQAFLPIAFLAGVGVLAVSVPALTDPPDHAPAHGHRDKTGDYPPQYHERYADQEFRYVETACEDGGEAALGAVIASLAGESEVGAQLGAALSDCDRSQFATAARIAFDNNAPAYWRNPQTGYRGVVAAGAPIEGYAHECRRAEAEFFTRNGVYQSETVTLCRDGNGGWAPTD